MTTGAPSLSIYGLGRAGSALAASALNAGLEVRTLWNRDPVRASQVAAELGRAVSVGPTLAPAQAARVVVLATSEHAIEVLTRQLIAIEALAGVTTVAHMAGAVGTASLAAILPSSCAPGMLHPARALQGSSTPLTGAFCALNGTAVALHDLGALAAALSCDSAVLEEETLGLYHAGCSMAANDIAALVELAAQVLTDAGLQGPQARHVALDLACSALDNLALHDTAEALTGPVARGDARIVQQHLSALRLAHADAAELHRACSLTLLHTLRRHGSSGAGIDAVAELLAKTP